MWSRLPLYERPSIRLISCLLPLYKTVLSYFIPILRNIPIFGEKAAENSLWEMNLSLGFMGQGMLSGPAAPLHMLTGAVIGWGILGPIAKEKGWTTGPVDSWTTGSRGWIIWIAQAALLAECVVRMLWFFLWPIVQLGPCRRAMESIRSRASELTRWSINTIPSVGVGPGAHSTNGLADERDHSSDEGLHHGDESGAHDSQSTIGRTGENLRSLPRSAPIRLKTLGLGLLVSIAVCIIAVAYVFHGAMALYLTALAVLFSFPVSFVGIRALAEYDYGPQSAVGTPSFPRLKKRHTEYSADFSFTACIFAGYARCELGCGRLEPNRGRSYESELFSGW